MRHVQAIASLFVVLSVLSGDALSQESHHLTVSQWVRPAEPGTFRARVVNPMVGGGAMSVPDAKVVLLGTDGSVHQGTTNSAGDVSITGVNPGVYAMMARGYKAFASYALHVLGHQHVGEGVYPDTIEIAAANIDYADLQPMMIPYLSPEYDRSTLSLNDLQFDQLTAHTRGNESTRVMQNGDGLQGRIAAGSGRGDQLLHAPRMNVFLIKDSVRIARTVTGDRGEFRFDIVDPGLYSLVAVGPDGLGVVGFELTAADTAIEPANVQNETADGKRFVVQLGVQQVNEFELQVIPIRPEELTVIDDRVIEEEVIIGDPIITETIPMEGFGVPISGGGFVPGAGGPGGGYGGGGGGYGGGGGGSGFGGLAALAGIGAVVAATSSDDDASRPISPNVPTQ